MNSYTVYTLVRQDTGAIIYVGCTNNPKRRWAQHRRYARYRPEHQPVSAELHRLTDAGVVVEFKPIVAGLTKAEARLKEARLIMAQQAVEAPLMNVNLLSDKTPKVERAKRGSHSGAQANVPRQLVGTVKTPAMQRAAGIVNNLQNGSRLTPHALELLKAGGAVYLERAEAVMAEQGRNSHCELRWAKPNAAAADAGTSQDVLSRWIRQGRLKVVKSGKHRLVDPADVCRLQNEREKQLATRDARTPEEVAED